MYPYLNDLMDEKQKQILKKTVSQNVSIEGSSDEQNFFRTLINANINFQSFSEQEKRVYKILVQIEKEFSFKTLSDVIKAAFDLGLKEKSNQDDFFYITTNTAIDAAVYEPVE